MKDANGNAATAALSITIAAALSVTTTSLPGGMVGTPYSATLTATGGTTPYTWSITSGTLPAGLSLTASSGAITGIPTAAGPSSFTVQVKDANGNAATEALSITIAAAPNVYAHVRPITIDHTKVPNTDQANPTFAVRADFLPESLVSAPQVVAAR